MSIMESGNVNIARRLNVIKRAVRVHLPSPFIEYICNKSDGRKDSAKSALSAEPALCTGMKKAPGSASGRYILYLVLRFW